MEGTLVICGPLATRKLQVNNVEICWCLKIIRRRNDLKSEIEIVMQSKGFVEESFLSL